MLRVEELLSHSSECSMVHHQNICGRTTKGQSTGFRREREVNKATP